MTKLVGYSFRRTHCVAVLTAMAAGCRREDFEFEIDKRRWASRNHPVRDKLNAQLGWAPNSSTFFIYVQGEVPGGIPLVLAEAIMSLYL